MKLTQSIVLELTGDEFAVIARESPSLRRFLGDGTATMQVSPVRLTPEPVLTPEQIAERDEHRRQEAERMAGTWGATAAAHLGADDEK